jgi:hypothetical protein
LIPQDCEYTMRWLWQMMSSFRINIRLESIFMKKKDRVFIRKESYVETGVKVEIWNKLDMLRSIMKNWIFSVNLTNSFSKKMKSFTIKYLDFWTKKYFSVSCVRIYLFWKELSFSSSSIIRKELNFWYKSIFTKTWTVLDVKKSLNKFPVRHLNTFQMCKKTVECPSQKSTRNGPKKNFCFVFSSYVWLRRASSSFCTKNDSAIFFAASNDFVQLKNNFSFIHNIRSWAGKDNSLWVYKQLKDDRST